MKSFVSSPFKFSDPLLSCIRVRLSDFVSGASATTWQMQISPMILRPVVLSRKELISWSNADRGKQCFSNFCLALLSAVWNKRKRNIRRMSTGERQQDWMFLNVVFNNCRQMISSQIHTCGWSDSYHLQGQGFLKIEKGCGALETSVSPRVPMWTRLCAAQSS